MRQPPRRGPRGQRWCGKRATGRHGARGWAPPPSEADSRRGCPREHNRGARASADLARHPDGFVCKQVHHTHAYAFRFGLLLLPAFCHRWPQATNARNPRGHRSDVDARDPPCLLLSLPSSPPPLPSTPRAAACPHSPFHALLRLSPPTTSTPPLLPTGPALPTPPSDYQRLPFPGLDVGPPSMTPVQIMALQQARCSRFSLKLAPVKASRAHTRRSVKAQLLYTGGGSARLWR